MTEWIHRRSAVAPAAEKGFSASGPEGEFQRDRARIIHSESFRSLQSKTQVLGLGESDFYRTRLTHSLEVAQIGSGICEWLREHESDPSRRAWIPSFSLIEAICLAHDIGHSPFGHGGEVAMNTMMRAHGGFEANGQTLRILARLGEFSAHCGLDPARRTMLGTVKYPVTHSEVACYVDPPVPPDDLTRPWLNIDHWAPPKCIYDTEADILDWLLEPFDPADRERFRRIEAGVSGHRRSVSKSFDSSIMELADDVAYGVHDLEDALTLGLVDRDAWAECVSSPIAALDGNPLALKRAAIDDGLFSSSARDRKHAVSRLVTYFIRRVELTVDETFAHPLLALQASMEAEAYEILLSIKRFVMQHVIKRPELQMLQYKGQQVVVRLFEIFAANPDRLLPHAVRANYETQGRRAIADYLAGMTDVSAGKLYHKLLSPTSGSIFDRR